MSEPVDRSGLRISHLGFKNAPPDAGTMVACPTCDAPMEDGFLGAQNWPSGIQWLRSKGFFGVRGEPVGENDRTQMSWLAASRCPRCRQILASY